MRYRLHLLIAEQTESSSVFPVCLIKPFAMVSDACVWHVLWFVYEQSM